MTSKDLPAALVQLGLRGLADQLDAFLGRAIKGRLKPRDVVEQIVQIEQLDRAQRSLERRQVRSRIGSFKHMVDFDWNWPENLNQNEIETLLKLGFIDEGANVVIVGAHGLGKTMLLKNIAHEAVLGGYAVLYVTAAKMLGDLAAIDSPSKLERRIKYYSGFRLLCIDEVGYLSYDNRAADMLFEVITRRYEAGKSVALTTNLAFKDWTTVFPHATCTIALVDRLTHKADIIKLKGESWRRKEAQERSQQRRPQ